MDTKTYYSSMFQSSTIALRVSTKWALRGTIQTYHWTSDRTLQTYSLLTSPTAHRLYKAVWTGFLTVCLMTIALGALARDGWEAYQGWSNRVIAQRDSGEELDEVVAIKTAAEKVLVATAKGVMVASLWTIGRLTDAQVMVEVRRDAVMEKVREVSDRMLDAVQVKLDEVRA